MEYVALTINESVEDILLQVTETTEDININITEGIGVDEAISLVNEMVSEVPALPSGGLIGQRLTKTSDLNYQVSWTYPTGSGNDKAIQFNDAGAQAGDDNLKFDKNTKSLIIGIPDTLPDNPLAIGRAVNGWLQTNIQNTTEGDNASSDYVATADNGDDENYYIDMGIDSSIYESEDYTAYGPNDGYIVTHGQNLLLNAATPGKAIKMIVGGYATENIIAEWKETELSLAPNYQITNRPEILYGTSDAPSPIGLNDGTLYIKYV